MPQVFVEGVFERGDVVLFHHGLGDMGAADGAGAGYLQDAPPFDMHAKLIQFGYHLLGAPQAGILEILQLGQKFGVVVVDKVAQDMHLALGDVGAYFDAGYDGKIGEALRRRFSGGNTVHAVVVGQGDIDQPPRRRLPNNLGGTQPAVGGGGVHVEVDPTQG